MTHSERRGGVRQAPLTELADRYWLTTFGSTQTETIVGITYRNIEYWMTQMAGYPELLSVDLRNTAHQGQGRRRNFRLTDLANFGLVKHLHVQPQIEHEFDLIGLCALLAKPPEACESWARLTFEAVKEDWDDQAPFAFLRDGSLELVRGWYGVSEFTAETTSAAYVNLSLLGKNILEKASAVLLAPADS